LPPPEKFVDVDKELPLKVPRNDVVVPPVKLVLPVNDVPVKEVPVALPVKEVPVKELPLKDPFRPDVPMGIPPPKELPVELGAAP
jgi:hypothetical protein